MSKTLSTYRPFFSSFRRSVWLTQYDLVVVSLSCVSYHNNHYNPLVALRGSGILSLKHLPCRQFHQHFTYKFFVRTLFFYVHVTRKKLPKRHSYEKFVHKTLMKLTPGPCLISPTLYSIYVTLLQKSVRTWGETICCRGVFVTN